MHRARVSFGPQITKVRLEIQHRPYYDAWERFCCYIGILGVHSCPGRRGTITTSKGMLLQALALLVAVRLLFLILIFHHV